MDITAVIPAYNEEASVAAVVGALADLGIGSIVVDDGSTDRTCDVAAAAGAVVLRHPTNIGVGGALRTGFAFAVRDGHRRVVCIDADNQHDPSSVGDLVAAADRTDARLVIGSRFGDDHYPVSFGRRTLMRMLARIVSRRVGARLDDVTSGFRVVSEPLLSHFAEEFPTEYLGDTVEAILQAHRSGASITQTSVRMAPRPSGSATSRFHAAGHLVRLLVAVALTPRRGRA